MWAGSTSNLNKEVKFLHSALVHKNQYSRNLTEVALETMFFLKQENFLKQDLNDQASFQKQHLKDNEKSL